MTLQNTIDLFCGPQSQCHIQEKELIQIYSLCKMTNIEELNDNSANKYTRLRFVEFMELVGRAAELTFEGSFYEHIELYRKIEEILRLLYASLRLDAEPTQDEEESDKSEEYNEEY